ncbi:hypothetical protein NC653_037494 [Populus alba x Populus x berolinensis]|uniref:Uncharacterized protein n=1 Tax=Populus alba x Populus x berolinensis TaxID=444605 RepID=A0AAD6PTQ9_9ROSI|nr:hypothetical protein NC653_037494 [Populus alba x Populus x berolinensis]
MAAGQLAAFGRLVDGDGGNGSVERGSGRGQAVVVMVVVQVREGRSVAWRNIVAAPIWF